MIKLSVIPKTKWKIVFIATVLLIATPIVFATAYFYLFAGKIMQGVSISQVNVGGLTKDEAISKLKETVKIGTITLRGPEETYSLEPDSLELTYDYPKSAQEAYGVTRSGDFLRNLVSSIKILVAPTNIPISYTINEELLGEYSSVVAGQIIIEPVYPVIKLVENTPYVINGVQGRLVNTQTLKSTIIQKFEQGDFSEIEIEVEDIDPSLTDSEIKSLEERAQKVNNGELILTLEDEIQKYTGEGLLAFLNAKGGISEIYVKQTSQDLAKKFNRDPQNPVFEYTSGKVKEFLPAKPGIAIQVASLEKKISNAIKSIEKDPKELTVKIPFIASEADYKTEDINDLGIKELLGKGSSSYGGSIYSRSYNIALGSSNFNGVLVPPGEVLSFNNIVGDVSEYTGYKQSYIIKDGATVLGDGGGLCQVSTTLFRAALNAGLPITERRAHSYRVTYYEQDSKPGLDATVYSPTTDLKILNDTPAHILVQTIVDSANARLKFEIYGTSDGRIASVSTPITTSVSPPPEDLYIDDPTKPIGTIEQIDWKAWGAKVTYNYSVERDGEIIYEKTFYSNYRPWQAKFLRGTAPVN